MPKLGGGPPAKSSTPAKRGAGEAGLPGTNNASSSTPSNPRPVQPNEQSRETPASSSKKPKLDSEASSLQAASGPSTTTAASNEPTSDLPLGVQDSLALSRSVADIRRRRVSAVLNDELLYLSYLLPLRRLLARMAQSVMMASEGNLGIYFDELVGQGQDAKRLFDDLAEVERIFNGIVVLKPGSAPRRMEEENELLVDLRVVVEGLVEIAEIKDELENGSEGEDEEEEDEEEERNGKGEEAGNGTEGGHGSKEPTQNGSNSPIVIDD